MKFDLIILFLFASLTVVAYLQGLYFTMGFVLLLTFLSVFIKENIEVPTIRKWLEKTF